MWVVGMEVKRDGKKLPGILEFYDRALFEISALS
jgi:hypothetical protein